MFDYSKWIFSKDISSFLNSEAPINPRSQAECIISSPHRTISEKADGIREICLGKNSPDMRGILENLTNILQNTLQMETSDQCGDLCYKADLYWHGSPELYSEEIIFLSFWEAAMYIKT